MSESQRLRAWCQFWILQMVAVTHSMCVTRLNSWCVHASWRGNSEILFINNKLPELLVLPVIYLRYTTYYILYSENLQADIKWYLLPNGVNTTLKLIFFLCINHKILILFLYRYNIFNIVLVMETNKISNLCICNARHYYVIYYLI